MSQQYQKEWHEENRRAQRNGEGQPTGPITPPIGAPAVTPNLHSLERTLRVVDFSPLPGIVLLPQTAQSLAPVQPWPSHVFAFLSWATANR